MPKEIYINIKEEYFVYKKILSIVIILVMIMTMTSSLSSAQVTMVKTSPSYSALLSSWVMSPSVSGTTSGLPGGTDEVISDAAYDTAAWLKAKVPSTVLGNCFDDGVYDAFFMNRSGNTDEWYNRQFTSVPSADFNSPWWYSTQFELPAAQAGKRVVLTFKGISHVGDIYINGQKMINEYNNITEHSFLQNGPPIQASYADLTTTGHGSTTKYGAGKLETFEKDFFGTFRTYNVDVTNYLNPAGTANNIKVKVTKAVSQSADLTYHWVDWHPRPVDGMMGLTGEVVVSTSGDIRLDSPAVATVVTEDLSVASLSLFCGATNLTDTAITGIATAVVKSPAGAVLATVSKEVTVAPKKYDQEIAFRSDDFPQLDIADPELWWPYLSGDQPLHTIEWSFTVGETVSDAMAHRAGIRQVTVDLNVTPLGNQNRATIANNSGANMIQFYVNHKPIILKGGGYCPTDLFLRHDPVKNQGVIDNMKYAGMNFFRDEGKFFDNDLLDLCDENGIFVMTGWCCCDLNQSPSGWSMAERFNAYEGQFAQLKNLRQHASALLWFNGSDEPPSFSNSVATRMVEEQYIRVAALVRWDEIGVIATSACLDASNLLGGINTGMHMDSSYDNQTPSHMFNPATVGSSGVGPFGFIGEGLGGANIPPLESMKKFIPAENLWPYNGSNTTNYSAWNLHATTSGFTTFGPLVSIAEHAYGASTSLESWHAKVSAAQYDQYRAQHEALNYFRYKNTTGQVNWMLNNARPGMYWQEFDWYMNPTTATFGIAKANEPVHIMYNLYDHDVSVINSTFNDYGELTAVMEIYNLDGELISVPLVKTVDVVPDSVGPTTDYGSAVRTPKRTSSHYNEEDGTFSDVTYTYFGQIKEAYGVNILWKYDDIEASLVAPMSDVYFIRLQLKNRGGDVVSYNSYAISMRNDISTTTSWNRGTPVAMSDFSALNSLPALTGDELTCVQTKSVKVGENIVQTLVVSNKSSSVAHNVYLAAYPNNACEDLIGACQYTDNMFILFPGESRTIDVTHRASNLAGDAFITVTCYNNQIGGDRPIRYKNIYTGQGIGQGRSLSINRTVTGSGGGTTGNLTAITTAQINQAIAHKTFIDAAASTTYSPTVTSGAAWFYVDLGASKAFDEIMLRCTSGVSLRGRPDTVVIAGSDSTSGPWTDLASYDNTGGSIMMDIVLPATATYRYVRASVTTGTGSFNFSGMDIYAFNNYVNVSILGEGVVTSGGKTITPDAYANQSVLVVEPNGSAELTFTPASAGASILVALDGVDITNKLTGTGDSKTLVLSGLSADAELDVYYNVLQASIRTQPVTVFDTPATYTVSLANMKDVGTVTLDFTVNSNYLNLDYAKALTAMNGFSILSQKWVDIGGGLWKGTVTLMYPGFITNAGPLDILTISGSVFSEAGIATATLTAIEATGNVGGKSAYILCNIFTSQATTSVSEKTKVYSKYDLNKDGRIDILDTTIAVNFYRERYVNPGWATIMFDGASAKDADVNGSGLVDLADLIEIMANYRASYILTP